MLFSQNRCCSNLIATNCCDQGECVQSRGPLVSDAGLEVDVIAQSIMELATELNFYEAPRVLDTSELFDEQEDW